LHVFILLIVWLNIFEHSFPVPPPQRDVEGLEKMLPSFPLFGITLGAARRDVRSAKAIVGVDFLPKPGPG